MVPEQFVALPGGGGVDKFRLSEVKKFRLSELKNTQDGPGPPRIDKDLIRGGRCTSVFWCDHSLRPSLYICDGGLSWAKEQKWALR